MALALVGLGAGALAPATAAPGGEVESSRRSEMLALERDRNPEHRGNTPAEPSEPMRLGSNPVAEAARATDAGGRGRVRTEAVPAPMMGIIFPLRGEIYARLCNVDERLCDLVAAHLRPRTTRRGAKRDITPASANPRSPAPGRQDAAGKAAPCTGAYAAIR